MQLLPNIRALRCRLDLYEGNTNGAERWMGTAPDEDVEFCSLERYRYLTKVRCYLAKGEYTKAQALLEKLRYYAEQTDRAYIRMETGLLSAITKKRAGGPWREELSAVLEEAERFRFLRLITEEGAAVWPLLQREKKALLEAETLGPGVAAAAAGRDGGNGPAVSAVPEKTGGDSGSTISHSFSKSNAPSICRSR